MINQGYSYKVINKLGELENENLFYSKKDEQHELLKEVLAANESAAAAEDEQTNLRPAGSSQISRTAGTMSSLSGGDEGLYYERKNQSSKDKTHHPLFKKFFFGGKK